MYWEEFGGTVTGGTTTLENNLTVSSDCKCIWVYVFTLWSHNSKYLPKRKEGICLYKDWLHQCYGSTSHIRQKLETSNFH